MLGKGAVAGGFRNVRVFSVWVAVVLRLRGISSGNKREDRKDCVSNVNVRITLGCRPR